MPDAAKVLRSLDGRQLRTVTGRQNRILRVEDDTVIVGSGRSVLLSMSIFDDEIT
jgi:hypothetical protein